MTKLWTTSETQKSKTLAFLQFRQSSACNCVVSSHRELVQVCECFQLRDATIGNGRRNNGQIRQAGELGHVLHSCIGDWDASRCEYFQVLDLNELLDSSIRNLV